MRIAVIELDYHSENLISFCKAFQDAQEEIAVFTTLKVYQDVISEGNFSSFRWHLMQENGQTTQKFIQEHLSIINQHDILFFATVESQYYAYSSCEFHPITVLRIHMINSFFYRWQNISPPKNLRDFFDFLHYIFKNLIKERESHHLKIFLKRMDYLTLTHEQIDFCHRTKLLSEGYQVLPVIPLAVFDKKYYKQEITHTLYLTIPGNVDTHRRDYKMVIGIFEKMIPHLKRPVQLTILGRPIGIRGRNILKRFSQMKTKYFILKSYSAEVPQYEFNQIMLLTDVILGPLQLESQYKIFNEQYGSTKISGNYTDIIRYGKPSILPASVPVEKVLLPLVDLYSSPEELQTILLFYLQGNRLTIRKQQMFTALENFTSEKVKKQIVDIFSSLIRK
ncbi:MAG: hypothetical protein EPN85_00695 [Bacteroidetes bacterium]|nr:MAG: hypothetical protein EPN85_00695 [Bacteroidota bacterium]